MMKKVMLILSCLFLSVGLIYSQTITVSGVVVDDSGIEVVGASVVLKGTTTGAVTDIDGKFSLNVPSNSTLEFSLIGMKKLEMKATPDMTVVMRNDEALLNEVVVTAMGITREKKALGYATQAVKANQLVQAGNSDLAGALQGKVSGVSITPSSGMPGSSSQITIRGARSFTGDNTPLYVVDGMPITSTSDINTGVQNNGSVSGTDFANRATDINPSDIESVEILKGQAAAALYGLRASNGVIIITTKSGKNVAKGKPHINISSSLSYDKISRYPEIQTKYAQGSGGVYDPTNSFSWGPLISDLPNDPKYGGNIKNQSTQIGNTGEYKLHEGQYYVPQRANAGLDPWATPGTYKNARDFFNTGVTWSNSAQVSQAFDKSNYSVSLGTTTQDGIVPRTGMDRYTAKVNAETKLSNQWTTGFVGTYVNTAIKKAPGANDGLVATVFAAPPSYDLAGIPDHYKDSPYQQNNYRGSAFTNAYWNTKNNKFTEKTSRFYGNVYTNFTTNLGSTDKKLNVRYQLGADAYTTNYSDSWGYGNKGASKNGQIENYSWKNVTMNSLLVADFKWEISTDWGLSVVAGQETIHKSRQNAYQQGSNYNFAGWNHIANALVLQSSSGSLSSRTVGFFGNALISYKNMLYLGVTGREDIVSHMPRNNRSFFYPSVNGSFVFTELEALKDRKILDFGKIRASYAEVGQAGDYERNFFATPAYGGGFYQFTPITFPIGGVTPYTPYLRVYDPNLKPQNTRSYELGIDLTFLNDLLDVSYTYSRQNVKDQIFDIPLAGSTGIKEMRANGGKMHTNSHEISLNVNPIRTNLVDWSVGFNWTKISNYVDELAPGVESITLGGFVTPQVRAGKGYQFPVIYGSTFMRDDKGNFVVDEGGSYIAGEDGIIGKVSPDFILGFNTSLRIEKLRISAVFDWKNGGQMYHGTKNLMDLYGISKLSGNREGTITIDAVTEDGSKNTSAISYQDYFNARNSIDEASVYDNGFIKLRELSVSYPVYKGSWVAIDVNAFARNIIVWSELDDFDPESSQGNNAMGGAFERFSLPNTSSYGLGVNMKF